MAFPRIRYAFLLLVLALSCAVRGAPRATTPPPPRVVDIGAPGDEAYVVEGFYAREGPYPKSRIQMAQKNDFRWATNAFALRLPVFPNSHNELTFHAYFTGAMVLQAGANWRKTLFGNGGQETQCVIVIPREVVGDQERVTVLGRALRPRAPGAKDTRALFAIIERVSIRPVSELPKEIEEENLMVTCAGIPALDRLRGIERRPHDEDVEAFVEQLLQERANVVTMGAMYGTGQVFFPSKYATPHPQMNPTWIAGVTKALREKGFKILCWVVFNAQDLRRVEDFVPAKMFPQWQMQYIETPGATFPPRVGMCVVSSPYVEWYAKVLQEAASFDFDGFFFDGFYLGGIPHPSRPGCTCTYCAEAFRKDTGLPLPKKADWTDMTFKRWVRWRNERLLKTARYFQSEMRKVNPKITCTFNYNIWPFARKDWETAIPVWRIDDFGVSQHGYSGKFEEKWLLMGFKARIGRDMNPAHTDMWRAAGFEHTCGRKKPDLAWHEHEIKTFILCGLAHGITPWHSTVAGPIDLTARIHAEVAKREAYFSRDYVCSVGVLYSQNTHDFYGHIPNTGNLNTYRDGILGTWMLLTEYHVPFEFVFDNQIESGRFKNYRVLVLPNTGAMSEKAMNEIAAWVHGGGRLIATAETASYNEWGEKIKVPRLNSALGIEAGKNEMTRTVGKGEVIYLPNDPGLNFCRSRDRRLAVKLAQAITETPMPFRVEAPNTLAVNMFRSPDKQELWVHFLNVSAFMTKGDSGFRGLDQPSAAVKDVASDAQLGSEGQRIGGANVPARNVVFSLPGRHIISAKLVVADKTLQPDEKGRFTIPEIDLHDVLVIGTD